MSVDETLDKPAKTPGEFDFFKPNSVADLKIGFKSIQDVLGKEVHS